ncbi:MAG TPA: hypothetical protein VKY57_07725 [Chitinispirillaceae bacterium]|nr:hypothetical protein [Chitinispirillaceae bacterium]
MAIGWDFWLNENETNLIECIVSDIRPENGFYLAHLDHDFPDAGIYLTSRLNVASVSVPEPKTTVLLLGLLFLVAGSKLKNRVSNKLSTLCRRKKLLNFKLTLRLKAECMH